MKDLQKRIITKQLPYDMYIQYESSFNETALVYDCNTLLSKTFIRVHCTQKYTQHIEGSSKIILTII